MKDKAKEWGRTHNGYVAKVTDYSFEFVETAYDKKERCFKQVRRYTVMESYFI